MVRQEEGTHLISSEVLCTKAQLFPSSILLSFPSLRINPQSNLNSSTCLVIITTSSTSTGLPVTTSSNLFLLCHASALLYRVTGIQHSRHLDLESPHYPSIPIMPGFTYAFDTHFNLISYAKPRLSHSASNRQLQAGPGGY